MMFVVCVTIEVQEGAMDEFLPLMKAQAINSLEREAECHQFDVAVSTEAPRQVFLYEVYTDAKAFGAHLRTPHFLTFDAAVAPLIRDKRLTTYDRLEQSQ